MKRIHNYLAKETWRFTTLWVGSHSIKNQRLRRIYEPLELYVPLLVGVTLIGVGCTLMAIKLPFIIGFVPFIFGKFCLWTGLLRNLAI